MNCCERENPKQDNDRPGDAVDPDHVVLIYTTAHRSDPEAEGQPPKR